MKRSQTRIQAYFAKRTCPSELDSSKMHHYSTILFSRIRFINWSSSLTDLIDDAEPSAESEPIPKADSESSSETEFLCESGSECDLSDCEYEDHSYWVRWLSWHVSNCEESFSLSSPESLPELCHDIGSILTPEKSVDEICQVIGGLSNIEKYSLLFQHVQPPSTRPSIYAQKCNRRFCLRNIHGCDTAVKCSVLCTIPCKFSARISRNNSRCLWMTSRANRWNFVFALLNRTRRGILRLA